MTSYERKIQLNRMAGNLRLEARRALTGDLLTREASTEDRETEAGILCHAASLMDECARLTDRQAAIERHGKKEVTI